MVSKSFMKTFRKLDAYAKTIDDFRVRTATGGTVTLVCGFTIFALLMFETVRYMTPIMSPEIMVDGGQMEKLPINFDVSFPNLPCYMLSLDIMDESGEHMSDYDHEVYKERLDPNGKPITKEVLRELSNKAVKEGGAMLPVPENYCGPCYGANPDDKENQCCNTCDEVLRAYAGMGWHSSPDDYEQCLREGWKEKTEAQAEEGCRMHGSITMNKVRGNFHFSAGKSFSQGAAHIHDMSEFLRNKHQQNFMHTIHHLQFGSHEYNNQKQKRTKESKLANPLEEREWGNEQTAMMYQYFLKIVPTEFDFLNGKQLRTFQYSVSRQEQSVIQTGGLPGVFFILDHSPMRIIYSETGISFGSFLTSVCAIVGGLFSVATIVDSLLYRAAKLSKSM